MGFRFAKLPGLLAVGISLAPATSVQAAFPCTWAEGEYQVGEDNGTPLCERQADVGGGEASVPQPPQDHEGAALAARTNAHVAGILAALQATDDREKLEKKLASDPIYKRLKAGYWEFLPRPKGLAKGDGCAATFVSLNGGVTIAGPKGKFRQAALTFWGGNIPAAKQERTIKVTLTQGGGDPPATVPVIHAAMAGGRLSSITFTVPSAPALVKGILDKNSFAVSYKQKPWHKISWNNGNKARKYMSGCLAGK